MKKVTLFASLAVLTIVLVMSACSMEPKLTTKIYLEMIDIDSSPVQAKDPRCKQTIDILRSRLDYYGCKNKIEYNAEENLYTVSLPEKVNLDMAQRLLSTRGKIELWEAWAFNMDDMPTPQDSIYPYVQMPFYGAPYVMIHKSDTAAVRRMLVSYAKKKQWPGNLKLMWGVMPLDKKGSIFGLYMIRSAQYPQLPIITNSHIDKTSYSKRDIEWAVDVTLNSLGSSHFQRATRENLGKCLAIVVDDKVYSAPMVNSEITGGRLQITGDFTKEEAQELSSVFRYESLPLKIKLR